MDSSPDKYYIIQTFQGGYLIKFYRPALFCLIIYNTFLFIQLYMTRSEWKPRQVGVLSWTFRLLKKEARDTYESFGESTCQVFLIT